MCGRIKLAAVAVTLAISFSTFVHAQHASTAPKKRASGVTSPPPLTSQSPPPEAWHEVERRLDSIDSTLKKPDVESRLAEIEKAIKDLKQSSFLSTILPAIIAAFAAVGGLCRKKDYISGLGDS